MKEQNEITPTEAAEAQFVAENPIITPGDPARWPLLEVPSQECQFPLSKVDLEQLEKMNNILVELGDEAAGLAAVQIGYPRRIFMLNEGEDRRVFINPRVTAKSRETKKDFEGCLSLPNIPVYIPRPKWVTLEYFDIDGKCHQEKFTGFNARVIMHEMAHLQGRLITHELEDHTCPIKRNKFGMIIDSTAYNRIVRRRAKNKQAKKSRRKNRSI
jgi:peptide deformylase